VTTVGWLSCSQADVPDGDGWLSPREQATLAALRLERRRMDWRLGRWTAKRAVRAWLGACAPGALDAVEIIAAPDGAPEAFVVGRAEPPALSLSHRDGVAVCTVAPSKTAIGCDIEAVEAHSDAFVTDWFTEEERAAVQASPLSSRALVTALVWSGKESALKALREGLRLDTRDVVVRFGVSPWSDGLRWESFTVVGPSGRSCFAGRWRHLLGHVLTVVTPAPWDSDPAALVGSASAHRGLCSSTRLPLS
jgi:4'-phosphopantetheinyl transferase